MSTVSLEFGSTLADCLAKTVAADGRLADAAAVIAACAEAAVDVSEVIGRGMLGGADLAATGDHNSDGDVQKALDVLAHERFTEALRGAPVAVVASEEAEGMMQLNPGAPLAVAIDPLDGSSNIGVNMAVGSIFGIRPVVAGAADSIASFTSPGSEQIAAGFPSRERFLTDLTLDPPDATSDESGPPSKDEDYLILSTIHSAKGQEWKSVFVLNVVDGCIPSDLGTGSQDDIEEERRLLYVAMTRARDELHLMVPHRFFTHQQHPRGDRHVYASRTRFIPAGLLGLFEQRRWPAARDGMLPGGRPAPTVQIDLGARLRGMWQ